MQRSVPGWDAARPREGPVWEVSDGEQQGRRRSARCLPPQPLCLCVRTCAFGLEPFTRRLPLHIIFLPLSHPSPLQVHLAFFSAFYIFPSASPPFSPSVFPPPPPPPAFSTLPHPTPHHFVLAICLPFHCCPSSSEEEAVITEISQRGRRGLSWGEADRAARLSMADWAADGNEGVRGSQSWL